jgi:hypothetical protein
MRKTMPEAMFADAERSRLSMLRSWVLENAVTEIEMKELQFWNFAQLQPVAEKPWTTFMGRMILVPNMRKNILVFSISATSALFDGARARHQKSAGKSSYDPFRPRL